MRHRIGHHVCQLLLPGIIYYHGDEMVKEDGVELCSGDVLVGDVASLAIQDWDCAEIDPHSGTKEVGVVNLTIGRVAVGGEVAIDFDERGKGAPDPCRCLTT